MRALDNDAPHVCPEPRKWLQKIALALEKSLKQLQPDLDALVPKLIDGLEHSHAEPSLLLPLSFFHWTIVMSFYQFYCVKFQLPLE
jgi:hypothetical protein